MIFARLSTANIHYGLFGELQERPPPTLKITIGSVIVLYYGQYGKLLEGLEDQLMLNNDEIAGDTGDVEDVKTAENARDREDTRDAGEAENVEVAGNVREVGDKKTGRGNEGGDQGNTEVDNNEGDHVGVDIGGVPEDVKLGNNGMDDNARNQDN